MKLGRFLAGLAVIVVAGWVLVSEQLSGASADAVVNARLSTMHAAIAGKVSLQDRPLGSRVNKGEEIGSIRDPLVDTVRLNDLFMERDLAKAEVARLTSLQTATDATIATLIERGKTYKEQRIAELRVKLDRALERLEMLKNGSQNGRLDAAFRNPDEPSGVDSELPEIALNYASERAETLAVAIAAANAGVYIGDGYNDAPNSEQRVAELRSTVDGLAVDLAAASARLAALETRIVAEQLRTNMLGSSSLRSTVNGQLWEYLSADGEVVQLGQDVLRFVDCDTAIVTASVSENVYRGLSAGQSANFRLTGDSRAFPATVTRLAGSGAASVYGNLAVAPSQRHLERYDVTLLVSALRDDPTLRCSIGRVGRVFFEKRPLDWIRDLWQ